MLVVMSTMHALDNNSGISNRITESNLSFLPFPCAEPFLPRYFSSDCALAISNAAAMYFHGMLLKDYLKLMEWALLYGGGVAAFSSAMPVVVVLLWDSAHFGAATWRWLKRQALTPQMRSVHCVVYLCMLLGIPLYTTQRNVCTHGDCSIKQPQPINKLLCWVPCVQDGCAGCFVDVQPGKWSTYSVGHAVVCCFC